MDWSVILLIVSLLLNGFLLNIVIEQAKVISTLRRNLIRTEPIVPDDALTASIKEKIDTDGVITAIKFLRETQDMSLVEAKRLVDRITGRSSL
ncbi:MULTISPECIES: hypothetical protein [Exiguobacterium]|uniref:hypothetical protein n=1 Tax=Exiguobacterium TaxID=33986 RepID=UPI001BE80B48|nr:MULTISPECIES: hypothetical protein [Exiguobacterium]MCT4782683.1 hypothetical protein [Exiguobacterium himgiriensis]